MISGRSERYLVGMELKELNLRACGYIPLFIREFYIMIGCCKRLGRVVHRTDVSSYAQK